MSRNAAVLLLAATTTFAAPQNNPVPPPGNGENGQMGGIFGMGVTLPAPKTVEALTGLMSGLSGLFAPKSTTSPAAAKDGAAKSGTGSGITGLLGGLFGGNSGAAQMPKAASGSSGGGRDISAMVPNGPEYPKGKMTLKDFYDPGSGPYPAGLLTDPSLPNFVIYAPKNKPPASLKMPTLIWANGGCFAGGTPYAPFLTEVASHGYLALAIGAPGGAPPTLDIQTSVLPGPNNETLYKAEDATKRPIAYVQDFLDAQKWVEDGKADKYGNIDKDTFITAGSSCGGLMAYSAAYHNPKVKLIGVMNSGVIDAKKKYLLQELTATVAIINGGPKDVAYPNVRNLFRCSRADTDNPQGQEDFQQLTKVPVLNGELDSGHLGTFFTLRGGKYGEAMVALMQWMFRGDKAAKAKWLEPQSPGSLVSKNWQIKYKNVEKLG